MQSNTTLATASAISEAATPATTAPAATPAKRKPAPKAAKPAKPAATPAKPGRKPDAARADKLAERAKLIAANRAAASAIYNGPSLAVTSAASAKPVSAFAALLAAPKHRTTIAKLTIRDGSSAARMLANSDKSGNFNPAAFNCDAGTFSRLASVGYILASGDAFKLSPDGLIFARKAAKAAA